MVTLVLGIVRDLYDLAAIIARELRSREAKLRQQKVNGNGIHNIDSKTCRGVPSKGQVVRQSLVENKPLILDLSKNLADLVLPLEALGHIRASPGIQGLAGVVSSVIGIMTTWQPILKLVPS